VIVVGKQQSAEVRSGAFGVSEPDDDELLTVETLRLTPSAPFLGLVGCICPLRDDALGADLARGLTEVLAPSDDVLAVSDRGWCGQEEPLELCLAVGERTLR